MKIAASNEYLSIVTQNNMRLGADELIVCGGESMCIEVCNEAEGLGEQKDRPVV